ncbi:hypothetical protein [Streptomyces stelliscabiei]|uniref:hypothetical protein n=1 Tax=Streptomyces stelliscabiei TaxID=146820 RepID=UPI002FF29323
MDIQKGVAVGGEGVALGWGETRIGRKIYTPFGLPNYKNKYITASPRNLVFKKIVLRPLKKIVLMGEKWIILNKIKYINKNIKENPFKILYFLVS